MDGGAVRPPTFCTAVTRDHLGLVIALRESLSRHVPGARLVAVVADSAAGGVPASVAGVDIWGPERLALPAGEFRRMRGLYSAIELVTALKPFLLRAALEDAGRPAVYLDADQVVVGDLAASLAPLERGATLLTPHLRRTTAARDRFLAVEQIVRRAGWINTGFVGASRPSAPFLEWWGARLLRHCRSDLAIGLTDQGWVDIAPGLFPEIEWADPGVNVGWWSLFSSPLERDGDDGFTWAGHPVRTVHLSGFDPARPGRLTPHAENPSSLPAPPGSALRAVCDRHAAALARAGHDRFRALGYGFARRPSGALHSPEDRRRYRAALERWERAAGPEPRSPFEDDSPPPAGPRPEARTVGSGAMERLDPMAIDDFAVMLHELRGRELERVPGDARVVLSGGANADWYFPWFAARYAGDIERHIGVEAYAPPPALLPPGIEWLPRTLGDLDPVADASVDLVFAGQTIEHLWPSETAGFLAAAHRVLRPGGRLVMDSPNRVVTQSWAVVQPEHTLEFSVDEVVDVVERAGFDVDDVRGVWLCYDRDAHRMLPVDDLSIPPAERRRRIDDAGALPEHSFVWWLEARRADRAPDAVAVARRLHELGDRFRTVVAGRTFIGAGTPGRSAEDEPLVRAAAGQPGAALYGPFMPMPPGAWRAVFTLGGGRPDGPAGVIAVLQVTTGTDAVAVGERHITAADLPADGAMRAFAVDFDLADTTTMGLQTRVITTGAMPFTALTRVPVSARTAG